MEPHRRAALTAKCSARARRLTSGTLNHLQAFMRDLIDLKVLPIKLLFFMELGGIVTVWPHMSTHMAHLRLTAQETGLIVMLGSIAGIIAALSAGYIGDKMGNFKVYLGLALLMEGTTGVLLAFLPPAIVDVAPAGVASLNHHCLNDTLHVQWQREGCAPHDDLPTLNLTLRGCVLACQKHNETEPSIGSMFCDTGGDRCSVLFPKLRLSSVRLVNATNNSTQLRALPTAGDEGGDGSWRDAVPVACPAAAASCRLRCSDSVPLATVCAPTPNRAKHTMTLTLYIILRVMYSFCLGTTYTLIDTAVLSYCAEYGVDYGFQRLWGTLAALVVSPLSGRIIDLLSSGGEKNFRPGFYILGGFRIVSLVVLTFVNISFRHSPPGSMLEHTWEMIQNAELSVLFLVMLLTGMAVGHIETFTYVFLSNLGASSTLIGTTITVGSSVEVVMLAISGLCIRTFGHVSLIVFGILLYAVRLIGYSVIINPVYSLVLEMLDGINGGLMNAAVVTYASSMVVPELVATVRGTLGCFLFGGGRAVGAQLGGYLVSRFGHRNSFLMFAGVALLAAVSYVVFQLFLRHRRARSFRVTRPVVECPETAGQPPPLCSA